MASAGCDSMMQNTGTGHATQRRVCLISLVVVSAPDFLSCTCFEAQRDRVMEPINICPDKNRAADQEPLHGPSFFLLSFFEDLKWFQMLLGMTNRLRISTAASPTDDHLCNSFDGPAEYKSTPTLAS